MATGPTTTAPGGSRQQAERAFARLAKEADETRESAPKPNRKRVPAADELPKKSAIVGLDWLDTSVDSEDLEYHATPEWIVPLLQQQGELDGIECVFDPCAGAGEILVQAQKLGLAVRGVELHPGRADEASRVTGETIQVGDFLTMPTVWPKEERVALVMNPPFSQATEFAHRALYVAPRGALVFVLCPMTFLGLKGGREQVARNDFREHLVRIIVLPDRPWGVEVRECALYVYRKGEGGDARVVFP